jgi:hypothetical protein
MKDIFPNNFFPYFKDICKIACDRLDYEFAEFCDVTLWELP